MAEIILKGPWVAPGVHWISPSEDGTPITIPDEWVDEVPPGTIVVKRVSAAAEPTVKAAPGTLLREADWLRQASEEENAEVMQLRQPEPELEMAQPVIRRRSNVIPGSKV